MLPGSLIWLWAELSSLPHGLLHIGCPFKFNMTGGLSQSEGLLERDRKHSFLVDEGQSFLYPNLENDILSLLLYFIC